MASGAEEGLTELDFFEMPSPSPISFRNRLSTLHLWVCTGLIGLLSADVVMGMFNAGLSPLKPILFTLLAVFVTIASSLLKKQKGVVFYDLRSSWACKEVIAANCAVPIALRSVVLRLETCSVVRAATCAVVS